MNNLISVITAGALFLCSTPSTAAVFGYSNGECSRTASQPFRLGKTETQGCAIKITKEKLQTLKGHQITTLGFGFGSSRITDGSLKVFITTDLAATPAVEQSATIRRALSWTDVTLDSPYTITGEEEALCIGYTAEIASTGTLLLGDKTATSPATTYGILNGQWIDLHNMGYGNPVIRFEVAEAPALTDVMLHPIDLDTYMKAGESYTFNGYIYNFGTEPINSFDIKITTGDAAPNILHAESLNIAQYKSHTFEMPALSSAADGMTDVRIEVTNVNGAADSDEADNVYSAGAYFYPADMQKNILLEGFTGMACSNCPSGHATIREFLSQELEYPVIEVMHHAGYAPDFLTTSYDLAYTRLYGSSGTYAPAVMLNRTVIPGLGAAPVINTTAPNIRDAYLHASKLQPYVSLALESTFDSTTRIADVKVKAYVHNDLPSVYNTINVMLVQDNMAGSPLYQTNGGTNYVHTNVMRDALTGNEWGLLLNDDQIKAGATPAWQTRYTVPEAFANQYVTAPQEILIPVDINETYLVAYVSGFGDQDVSGYNVYNAVKVRLGESYSQSGHLSGITDAAINADDLDVYVADGKIIITGKCDTLDVFDTSGTRVNASSLRPGVYIVRAANGLHITTKKILVK